MTDNERKAIEEFLLDIDCLNDLSKWQKERFNVFDVLNITRNEIRHSNVLAWLFNGAESHGFGDAFFYEILNRIINNANVIKYDKTKILLMDLYSFDISREQDNIDILLVSDAERCVIAIENKVGTDEHSDQLNKYRKIIEYRFPTYNKVFVFLTPDGHQASDEVNWTILTYKDVFEAITQCLNKKDVAPHVKVFIEDYLSVLRRNVMEDKELKDICNRIYKKHKVAIDLIVNNSDTNTFRGQVLSGIKEILKEYEKDGKIIYPGDGTAFYLKELDDTIPFFDEPKSSWGTKRMYSNWFEVYYDSIVIHLELGGDNLSDEQEIVVDKLIEITKPKIKTRPFKWKRLINLKKQVSEDAEDIEGEAKVVAKHLLDELISKEMAIYNQIK